MSWAEHDPWRGRPFRPARRSRERLLSAHGSAVLGAASVAAGLVVVMVLLLG